MDIRELIGEATEYDKKEKLEVRRPKSWCKSISAFANSFGGMLAAQSSKQTHFLNISFWKDRIIPAFPDRNPLFHLVCNHQAMNEDVQCYNDLCTQSNKGVNYSDYEMIYD